MTARNIQLKQHGSAIEISTSAEISNELNSMKMKKECTSSSQNKERNVPTSFIPEESLADDSSIASVKKNRRWSSVAANSSVPDDGDAKGRSNSRQPKSTKKGYVMRKLSEPMHRSRSSNELTSIIRPSRYSSNNLAGLDATGERGMIRGTSCSDLDTIELQDDIPMGEKFQPKASATFVHRGVEFSTSAEVYVFKK